MRLTDREAMKSYRERWKGERKTTEKEIEGWNAERARESGEIGTGWCLYPSSFEA